MKDHRYILEPYKGMNTRYLCPNCGQKEFTRYIDINTGQYLNSKVGLCNRINSCGYHYPPREYFKNNQIPLDNATWQRPKPLPTKKTTYVPVEIFKQTLTNHDKNHFIKYLLGLFGAEVTQQIIARYYIGTSTYFDGATVFWQVDVKGRIHAGKIMQYDPETGRRVRKPKDRVSWVHAAFKMADFGLKQCLFGEHLLRDTTKQVCVCESEKTACIASVYYPNYLWLATGSKEELKLEKMASLAGRKVILFPDLKGFESWSRTAKELAHLAQFRVSTLIERKATEAEREQGLDLADFLIRYDYRDFIDKTALLHEDINSYWALTPKVLHHFAAHPEDRPLFHREFEREYRPIGFTEFEKYSLSLN